MNKQKIIDKFVQGDLIISLYDSKDALDFFQEISYFLGQYATVPNSLQFIAFDKGFPKCFNLDEYNQMCLVKDYEVISIDEVKKIDPQFFLKKY